MTKRFGLLLCIILVFAITCSSLNGIAAVRPTPQYLLFQIFTGGPHGGVFHPGMPKERLLQVVQRISGAISPKRRDPNRFVGFSVGPIAMDLGEPEVRSTIRDAFDVALATNMAVALHLDDYMFWRNARLSDGRLLREIPGVTEWTDWSGTPAGSLEIGWLPNANLQPQMCYENPVVKAFVAHWTKDVIGQEVKNQLDRLIRAGKAQLFAGVIVGWESNLAYGYCSLSHLGYSAKNPPADFDRERERVLQRHIEHWAKGIYDAGIPKDLIFSHLGPISGRAYNDMMRALPRSRIREIHQSTGLRAFWTAFNEHCLPGFSAHAGEGLFEDIQREVLSHGGGAWAMAEGTNIIPGPAGIEKSPISWESFLARNFNHGAKVVNLFGGFQGDYGDYQRATESDEAIAAYRKFLQGAELIEDRR